MRGNFLACVLVGAVALSATAGCRPLYGGKPEKPVNPKKGRKPPEPIEETAAVKYAEDCVVSFRDDPKLAPPGNKNQANQALGDGDAAMQQAQKAPPASQGAFVKAALEKYRSALQKDPYNTEATLKLAVAYDALMRKGCALALLKRIGDMRRHPRFQQAAGRTASDVSANANWFRGYRTDAIAAVGE